MGQGQDQLEVGKSPRYGGVTTRGYIRTMAKEEGQPKGLQGIGPGPRGGSNPKPHYSCWHPIPVAFLAVSFLAVTPELSNSPSAMIPTIQL